MKSDTIRAVGIWCETVAVVSPIVVVVLNHFELLDHIPRVCARTYTYRELFLDIISCNRRHEFSGETEVDLGTTDTRSGVLKGTYRIANRGMMPLEVSLVSASEGVSVEGLPLKIEADDYERISISAVVDKAGDYNGTVTLRTNDLTQPEITISLTGSVK